MPVTTDRKEKITRKQLAWFIALYCAGLLVTALVVYFFRALLGMG